MASQCGTCHLWGNVHEFSTWKGNSLATDHGFIAFKLVMSGEPPSEMGRTDLAWKERVVFGVASSGRENVVVDKKALPLFIAQHLNFCFVTHDVQVQWTILMHLLRDLDEEAWDHSMELVNRGRVRDVLILDTLMRLAMTDDNTDNRSLEAVLKDYNPLYVAPEGDSPAQVFGKHFFGNCLMTDTDIDLKPPIFSDSLADVIAILPTYRALNRKAVNKMNEHHEEIYAHSLSRYGPLSEVIQVKGALALMQIEISGMHIDESQLSKVQSELAAQLSEAVADILKNPEYDGLFKLVIGENGELVPSRDLELGKPSINQERLQQILDKITQEIEEKSSISIIIPRTESGKKGSLSRKVWQEYEEYHPFIKSWLQLELVSHLMSYLHHIKGSEAHPKYVPIVRNGRTSAKSPPIQQTPRSGGFREIFSAHPGKLFVIVDYNYIELCTLAAVCEHRYGFSRLADVIRHGYDPHAFTASMFSGVPFTEFLTWKNHTDPGYQEKFKLARQRAKAINFGIPSGLTPQGLGQYAKSAYGAEFSVDEAKQFRNMLITDIYPEIGHYLADCEMETLADNLGCPEQALWNKIAWKKPRKKLGGPEAGDSKAAVSGGVRNILRGKPTRHDGKEYSASFVSRVWRGLEESVQDPEAIQSLVEANQVGSEELFKKLLGKDVCTLTGRIRGKVGFTQSCNTAFSGLAADGAKLALWNLMQVGYNVSAFIHDEMLVEIPEESDWDAEISLIVKIICSSMQELVGTIPINCEYALSRTWSKQAVAVYDMNGCIQIWKPKK